VNNYGTLADAAKAAHDDVDLATNRVTITCGG
jgi:hypothetical protein